MKNNKIAEVTIPLILTELFYEELIFLKLLYEERLEDIKQYMVLKEDTIPNLEVLGYIKRVGETLEEISLREPAISLFETSPDQIKKLSLQIRNLFPSGVKSGGYLVRSNEKDIAYKLKQFFNKYKYSEETILSAVSKYIEEKRIDNWKYMMLANYFILKDNQSALASYCEAVEQGEEREDYDNTTQI